MSFSTTSFNVALIKFEQVISIIIFRNITIVDPKFSYGQGVIIGSEVQRYLKHILLHLWKHFSGSSNEKHCVWRRASVTGCQLWSGKIPHMQRWSKTNFILDEMKWRRWSKHKKQEINTLRELRVCLSFGHWTPSLMFICTLYALYMHFLVHISIFWSNHGTNTVNTIFCLS